MGVRVEATAKYRPGQPFIFLYDFDERRLALGHGEEHHKDLAPLLGKPLRALGHGWWRQGQKGVRLLYHERLSLEHVRGVCRALAENGNGEKDLILFGSGEKRVGRVGDAGSEAFARAFAFEHGRMAASA